MRSHGETFDEARNYVIERLSAGEGVSPGVLMFFPAIAKELQSEIVTVSNFDEVAATLPGQMAERLEVGCKVWPVYLDGTTGVAVEWPEARRAAVAYVATTRGGRRWMKPVFGSLIGSKTKTMVSDDETKGFCLGFDEYGRILPGGMNECGGVRTCLWKTDYLTFQFVPATGMAAVWSRGKEVVVGRWDAEKHQVVIGEAGSETRVSAYGEIVDKHGNVYVAGRKARNILIAKADNIAIGKGLLVHAKAAFDALKAGFGKIEAPAVEAPRATELAYSVGADNVVSFVGLKKTMNA